MVELWSPSTRSCSSAGCGWPSCEAQRDLGVDVPDGVIEAYEAVIDKVDLDVIDARERVTRHDVKARIEEFCGPRRPRARPQGHDVPRPHRERRAAPGPRVAGPRPRPDGGRPGPPGPPGRRARRAWSITGRSHNVAAQATTLGKRFANAGEELLQAFDRVEDLLARYPLRGLKGPVGTPAGPARPARRRPGRRSTSSSGGSPSDLGFTRVLTQRRPGVPPVPRPRRRVRPRPGRRPARRAWPSRSGSWPAPSSPPRASPRARWGPRPCPTR